MSGFGAAIGGLALAALWAWTREALRARWAFGRRVSLGGALALPLRAFGARWARVEEPPAGAERRAFIASPWVALWLVTGALAALPWGRDSQGALVGAGGGTASVFAVVGLLVLARIASALALLSSRASEALLESRLAASHACAWGAVLLLAMASVSIGHADDLSLRGLIDEQRRAGVFGWLVFQHPLSACACVLVTLWHPPELSSSRARRSGLRAGRGAAALEAASELEALVIASLIATVFLGGPSQASPGDLAAFSATVSFIAKVVLVRAGLGLLRALPAPSPGRARALSWRLLLALVSIELVATGVLGRWSDVG